MSGRLREHDFDDPRCAECRQRDPVGPCAACEAMICGDCGVMTTDPGGTRVICLSCARLVASVEPRRGARRGRPLGVKGVAVAVLVAFAAAVASLLLR